MELDFGLQFFFTAFSFLLLLLQLMATFSGTLFLIGAFGNDNCEIRLQFVALKHITKSLMKK